MSILLSHLEAVLKAARQHGADHADALITQSRSRSAMIRQGKAEGIRHAETLSLGLRVFCNGRMASVSGNECTHDALTQLAERACAMAKVVPPSPYDGLSEHPLIPVPQQAIEQLELCDASPAPTIEEMLGHAREMEETALSHTGITNSSGASASAGHHEIALATSAGFEGGYQRSQYGYGISVLAGAGAHMQRDYAFHSASHLADLHSPHALGEEAATRALARLNPSRPKTGTYPVIFDRRVAGSLLGHFAAAINGAAIVQEASFLKDKLHHDIFNPDIHITDDPTLPRLSGSRPFDGEGTQTRPLQLIEAGRLNHWLLDSRCARQLGLAESNGRAVRGTTGAPRPGTSNLYLHNGAKSPKDLRCDINEGIFITELMGNAINMLTGDYSRGGSGFMIRNGELAEPVSGITIAGNLHDMFKRLVAANDLDLMAGFHAPTIRIDQMSLAGD